MRVWFIVIACLISGCSSLDANGAFSRVQGSVTERSGNNIAWETGSNEDIAVEEHLDHLLSGPIELSDAIQVSLLKNPTLQAEYEELGIAQAEIVKAGLLQNPLISLERRSPGKAAEYDVAQNFLSLLVMPLALKAARANLDAQVSHVTQAVLDHLGKVKRAFYDVQASNHILALRRTGVQTVEVSQKVSAHLMRAGNMNMLAIRTAQNRLAEAKVELIEAELETFRQRETLNVLMGVWGDRTKWTVADEFPSSFAEEPSLASLERFAIANRPELAAEAKELERLAAEVGIAKFQAIFPDLSVTGHSESEPDGNRTAGANLSFPLPLFNWGQASSVEGSARFRQAAKHYEALAIEVRSKVRVAFAEMSASRARAEYFQKELLPLMQSTIDETQKMYNGMLVGVFDLLETKQSWINAKVDYAEVMRQYWHSVTELEALLGTSLGNIPPATSAGQTTSPLAISRSTSESDEHKGKHKDDKAEEQIQ